MDEADDHGLRREGVISRWVSACRTRSALEAALAEATTDDVGPAIDSALFVAELGQMPGDANLAMHEAAAMWNLLGRSVASRVATASAGLRYASSILDAMEVEGVTLAAESRIALETVFAEGFVLAREEQARSEVTSAHLASLVPRRVAEGVELLILSGPYEAHPLAGALEGWVREAFRRGARAAIIDLLGAPEIEPHARALRETCLVLASLGIEPVLVGAPDALELPADCRRVRSLEEALTLALSARDLSGLALARVRRLFSRS